MGDPELFQDVNFPFDREREVALELLFKSFCNNIALGQWELARACLKDLHSKRQDLGKPLKEILRTLIDRPLACCTKSPTLPSPFHLSWLCLVEYLDLYPNKQLPKPVEKTVEFRLLLYSTCCNASRHLIQDLDGYYSQIVYGEHTSTEVSNLPSTTLSFLKQLLNENPDFGHALITELTGHGPAFLDNNQLLQALYIDLITQHLSCLDVERTKEDGEVFLSGNIQQNPGPCKSEGKHVYKILSLMNPSPDMIDLQHKLDLLFQDLINRTKHHGSPTLNRGQIYSCLLGRTTMFLIDRFCEIENRMRFQFDESLSIGSSTLVACPMVQVCLSQSYKDNRECAWEELFYHALRKDHALENIVETALLFVKHGDFEKVTLLLSPVELQMLKPLVLLLGWQYCYSCENARTLLQALWDDQAQSAHPLLHQACQKLAYQVQLVQWCLDKARPLLASAESGSTTHQQASEMFQGLESHSVLHVLDRSVSLAHLPEREVFSLLKLRPVFNPTTAGDESGTSEHRGTSMSSLSEGFTESGFAMDREPASCLHPEVERDVVLYHSFCASRYFMEAITMNSCCSKKGKDESFEDFRDEKPSTQDIFLTKLQQAKKHLSQVYPLTYRVEILENAFSLLFTTYEDLYEETTHHDSDVVDTADEETKSLNTSLTGSMESLVSVTSADQPGVEQAGQFSPLRSLDKSTSVRMSPIGTRDHSSESSQSAKRQLFQTDKPDSIGVPPSPISDKIKRTLLLTIQDVDGPKARQLDAPRDITGRSSSMTCSEDPRECETPCESGPKIGFVMSDDRVMEYLKTIKQTLMELTAAKLESRRDGEDMRNRPDWIITSVPGGSLDQRVSRLGQYIVEAEWRHQLVSWTDPDERRGKTRKKTKKRQPFPGSPDWTVGDEQGTRADDEAEGRSLPSAERSTGQARQGEGGSDESSSYLSQEVTTGTEDNVDTRARRKRSKKFPRASRPSESESLVVKDGSVVARMLSTPDTLIYMCMRKDSYDRANQVIKMFQMENKPSALAAMFATKYENAFRQLSSLQPRVRKNGSRQGPGASRSLGAVAMAAASGVTSSVVSSIIDELLTSADLDAILLPDLNVQELVTRKVPLSRFVGSNMVPTMVCLDLACTANLSWEVCRTLLEISSSRLKREGSPVKLESSLLGVGSFLDDLRQTMSITADDSKSKKSSPKPNAVDLLLTGIKRIKHQSKSRESSKKLLYEQEDSLQRMEHALEEGDSVIMTIDEAAGRGRPDGSKKPGFLGTRESFSQVEKSLAVRIALADVQKYFDCIEAVDYLAVGGGGAKERIDYVRSLVNYVDTLATLLLHWQAEPTETPSSGHQPDSPDKGRGVLHRASNPFVVLNEGIADTLGRPMFEKNVSPKRLESVSKQLHVNLVKVIVHNCCPQIPVSGVTTGNVQWPSSAPVILNATGQWHSHAREPNVVAKELLSKMIDLLKGAAQGNFGIVDGRSAAIALRSPEFQALARSTEELQNVDLDLLHTNTNKLCFFANVLNLLLAHALLVQFVSREDEDWGEQKMTRHGSLSELLDSSGFTSFDSEAEKGSVLALERISFLKRNCYAIGQLGTISAFDMKYVILHTGLIPPSTFGLALQLCYPERPADDPKRKYKPTSSEKRIVFAISDGCVSSPDLQVLDVDTLDAELTAAVVTYINSHITINPQQGQIVLPELLKWYKRDFERSPFNDNEALVGDTIPDAEVSLLLQLEPFLNPEQGNRLQAVLPNIKEISFTPFCWKFGYRFEIPHITESSSTTTLRRSSSLPDSLQLSNELTGSLVSVNSLEHRGRYPLNQSTADYLEKTSPLVAALAGLICSLEGKPSSARSKRQEMGGEPRSKKKPKVSESFEISFKSALERTSKFPPLQRYLVARFYSMSEFLSLSPVDHDKIQFSGSYELVKWDPKYVKHIDPEEIPEISLFPLALCPDGSRELQRAFLKISDYYLRQGNFQLLLELLNSSSFHSDGSGGSPVDFLITSAILSKGGTSTPFSGILEGTLEDSKVEMMGYSHKWRKKPWSLLKRLADNEHLAQLVLSKLREWRARDGLDLLDLCLSRPPKSCALKTELERRRKELKLYMQITRCAKSPQLRSTITEYRPRSTSLLTQWQGVAAASIDEPESVMEFLLSLQQYELAAEWAEVEALPSHFHETVKESHLKHLLESSPEDTMKAYRILEGIQEQQMALSICESLLQQNLHVSQTLFIIQFMLTNLYPHLSPLRREGLLLTKMGAKALLCLPEDARPSYENLVSRPPLLLEQLLMNLKVDWAERVFRRLQVDLAAMEETDTTADHGCTSKAFDELLAKYAHKALEFKVVQPDQGHTRNSSPSTSVTGRDTPLSMSGRHPPLTSTPIKDRAEVDSNAGSPEARRRLAPGRVGAYNRSTSDTFRRGGQQSYLPPAIPPRKEEWMPDTQVSACVICTETFSMFNRRHHCRRCGRVVCSTCSPHACHVQGYGKDLVRVCSTCYDCFYATRHQDTVEGEHSPSTRSLPYTGGGGSLDKSLAHESLGASYNASTYRHDIEAEGMRPEVHWKLTLDPEKNVFVRDEFCYEQAPSSSLCIAILDLYSDNSACGRLILELCNTLSQILVPLMPGMRNEELDHNLIISMIRYLLFNAKLKMIKAGETQGLELCDTYLGHVDLMKFLVESNCGDIPSLQDLMNLESARRLRDRFIEDERLTLAMEVSTKCGLDPSGVWAAAGFACLRAGDFASAREKFARCIKPLEGSKQQKQSSQFLEKVLDIIQSSPLISFPQATDALLSPLHGLADHCKSVGPGTFLDSKRFDECLFYLHTYGSHAAVVSFFVRHGHIKLACRYLLDKKCAPEVFVESLLMRLVSKGSLSALKDQMESTDPTLQSWFPYITAACRYLHKRGYLHLLYDLQLFMKDYFRAAQTCIRFYESGASSYVELHSRLEHLSKARAHIEAVIMEKRSPRGSVLTAGSALRLRSPSGSTRREESSPSHVALTLSDLNSYVNTINLQVEVTNFLNKCAVDSGSGSGLRAGDDGKLPTLFGNGHMRGEVATQVLLAGQSIQDGFNLTSRIIQDYNLPAARVYIDTGRALARQYRYQHIQQLLRCVSDTRLVTDKCHDEIILACVRIISADASQTKHVDSLIRLLKSDSNKINGYLLCGKLRSAYLIAVKERRVEAIEEIAQEAEKAGQRKTVELCKKWLAQNQKLLETNQKLLAKSRLQER